MPRFSSTSKARLSTCHSHIQQVFNEVIKYFDCKILEGHRDKETQDRLFHATPPRTQVRWPNSKHNSSPSLAVDVFPYPINWGDRERAHLFAGYVLATAKQMGIDLRWGGDWDMDTEVDDNRFDDLPHFELVT
jgi:hypothetical protein